MKFVLVGTEELIYSKMPGKHIIWVMMRELLIPEKLSDLLQEVALTGAKIKEILKGALAEGKQQQIPASVNE